MHFSDNELPAAETNIDSNQVPGGENVDKQNIVEWFGCDQDLSAFKVMSDSEIVRCAQAESDSDEEERLSVDCAITHDAVLNHLELLLGYLEDTRTYLCNIMEAWEQKQKTRYCTEHSDLRQAN